MNFLNVRFLLVEWGAFGIGSKVLWHNGSISSIVSSESDSSKKLSVGLLAL